MWGTGGVAESDVDTRPGGGRVSRSAAVIYCTERSTRAECWAVGCREAGARGFDATRIVFLRRVAPNLRAASRRDPTGAQEAARILRQRGGSLAAERDTLPPPGLHRTSDGPIEADPDDRCRGGVYWSAIVKITSATMMNASTAKKILIQLYGCSPAIDPVTPFTTTW